MKRKQLKVKLTPQQEKRKARENAMPEVKRLVQKYGRSTISGCLQQLRDYAKSLAELEAARAAVAALEKQV